MSSLRTETVVIDYVLKSSDINKAKADFDKLTDAEKKAVDETKKLNDELKTTGKEGSTSINKASQELNNFSGIAKSGAGLVAGFFSVVAITQFARQVFDVTAKFQAMSAVLKNTLGSGSAASQALEGIKEFAKTTPFAVTELTASFVKLANQGFTPTIDQMRRLGDLASSTGKSFDQLAEAIIDAQVGEFERLKEFGVRAQKAGDDVIFTFKGVETQVKFNNAAIREYLVGLGDYVGVAGSAAAVSETLGGKVNNLGDAWDNFLNKIGTLLEPILKKALNVTAEFMDDINSIFKLAQSDAERYAKTELDTYKFYQEEVLNYTDGQLDNFVKQRQTKLVEAQSKLKEATEKVKAGSFSGGLVQVNPKAEQDAEKLKLLIAGINGQIAAAQEQIKMRNDATQKTIAAELALAQAKKTISDEEIKAAKTKYQLEEKRLELITQLRKIEMDSKAGNLGADKALYDGKLQLMQKYGKLGVQFSKEEKDLLIAQSKKAGEDLIQQDKKDHIESKNELDDYLKSSAKSYDQYLKAIQKKKLELAKTDKTANKEFVQDETEKWRKIVAITQAYSQLANQIVQGFADLQYSRIQNEITLMNRKYDEETRLAGDNQQKLAQIAEKRAQKEKELRTQQFEAQRQAAIAEVIFRTAPIIAQQIAGVITAPLAIASYAAAATQIGFILAQPVPEFAEGTKGTPFKGTAIVGEKGPEKVVTESGKVYFTPGVATLAQFDEAVQIIPNNQLGLHDRQHLSLIYGNSTKKDNSGMQIVSELAEIKKGLAKMPVAAISLDAKGFQKSIRTQSRTTTILNNRMKN